MKINPQQINPIINADGFMVNRDQSWLQFNQRVLYEAQNESYPLMERFRFLCISLNNLDEFFMIRIGSLYDILTVKKDALDSRTNIPLQQVIKTLYKDVGTLLNQMEEIYLNLLNEMALQKIFIVSYSELSKEEKNEAKQFFMSYIKPFLSPHVIDANHPFPHIASNSQHIALRLEKKEKSLLGLILVPSTLSPLFKLSNHEARYVRIDELILYHSDLIFSMYDVVERTLFSVTRNADINYYDDLIDDATNTRTKIKQLLNQRKMQQAIRLELSHTLTEGFQNFLQDKFQLKKYQIYTHSIPTRVESIRDFLANDVKLTKKALFFEPYQPKWPQGLSNDQSMISQVIKQDVLLHYPYQSMEPFLKLVKEAADHDDVMSIKITIYRLAKTAKLIEYLSRAAENGKEVVVIIELRARFDEQNNIDWSERLEKAGCKIMYGMDYFKVHSKICLVTMKQKNQIKYITQVSTGNYNERTVELYEDFSLMTSHPKIGEDAANFFSQLLLNYQENVFEHLLVAPQLLKSKILDLIREEKDKKEKGFIMMKINAITDVNIIAALAEASQAGVEVKLIARSICCIRPEVPGKTPTIKVKSIVGRFLEHSRVYVFGSWENPKIYLSSADIMTRNTERRVEVAIPIYDKKIISRIKDILDLSWNDFVDGHWIQSNGTRVSEKKQESVSAQSYLMHHASS